ncbi:MAG: hydroxyisourate hydrolase [Methylophilaceae bacterium]
MFQKVFLYLALCLTTSIAYAANNPLSVHVLNTQDGLPSPGVQVTLEQMKNGRWTELNAAVTNEQGRVTALYPEGKKLDNGTYKVTFKTGQWFKERKIETFFPEVPIIFDIDGKLNHYHIPLLLSPYGYSTYRGN